MPPSEQRYMPHFGHSRLRQSEALSEHLAGPGVGFRKCCLKGRTVNACDPRMGQACFVLSRLSRGNQKWMRCMSWCHGNECGKDHSPNPGRVSMRYRRIICPKEPSCSSADSNPAGPQGPLLEYRPSAPTEYFATFSKTSLRKRVLQ